MTATAEKKPKQPRLPGMSNDLEKAVDAFIDNKRDIANMKAQQETLEEKILIEMKKENRKTMVISDGGDLWEFEILDGVEKLRCAKATKTPAKDGEELPIDTQPK